MIKKSASKKLRLWVDGDEKKTRLTPLAEGAGFCILNELDPRDSFYINGFYRHEMKKAGYFRFTDADVDYPGNATIDEVISYGSNSGGSTTRQRYNDSASFDYRFVIPEKCILGPVFWTSYPSLSVSSSSVTVAITDYEQENTSVQSLRPKDAKRNIANKNDLLSYQATFDVKKVGTAQVCPALDSLSLMYFYIYPRIQFVKIE